MQKPDGTVALDALLSKLRRTEGDIAEVLGVPNDAVSVLTRLRSAAGERELRDPVEILTRVSPWAGSIPQAFAWFTVQPLSSFGGQTGADLVRDGRADAVKSYVARLAAGGNA